MVADCLAHHAKLGLWGIWLEDPPDFIVNLLQAYLAVQ